MFDLAADAELRKRISDLTAKQTHIYTQINRNFSHFAQTTYIKRVLIRERLLEGVCRQDLLNPCLR